MDNHYTMQQVAENLQISVQTVRREIARGNLKATSAGKQIRISETALKAYDTRMLNEIHNRKCSARAHRNMPQQIVPHIAPYKRKAS